MNPLDSFTVERLEELIKYENFGSLSMVQLCDLAKIALAAKQAEYKHARLEVSYGDNNWIQCSEESYKRCKAEGKMVRKLYETPPLPQLTDNWVMVPKVPSQAHLNSIAMRYRHDFYLLTENQKLGALTVARQMYEECSGQGFFTIPTTPKPE